MTQLRPPHQVMRLSRLGSSHQTRLSFMRVLLRKMRAANWTFDRPVWNIANDGTGYAVFRAIGRDHTYSLVAFAHDLPANQRTDRVIAEAWDATFALVDGTPNAGDIKRLSQNVPLQEAGRVSDRELVLSRANRSVRLWDQVVDALARGDQPDTRALDDVGYLMRTTAVYGSGKFGAADRAALAGRDVVDGPFRVELLAVYLIRCFCLDLVEHQAHVRGGDKATVLKPALRRGLGIGNSTGLGMAPFLVNHPLLLDRWISARETALARIRGVDKTDATTMSKFEVILQRWACLVATWRSDHPLQIKKCARLKSDISVILQYIKDMSSNEPYPWHALIVWAETALSEDGQELVVSAMIEAHGPLVDDLADEMSADETARFVIDGARSLADVRAQISTQFAWATACDFAVSDRMARFWYTSQAKLEPRLGERFDEPGAEAEQPLDIARQVWSLSKDLDGWEGAAKVADLLRQHPEHRRILRRLQMAKDAPYAEIHDNLIDAELMPIDMLRCKLAFFGATRFDPRSDRWVRITMYQNAPFPNELATMTDDDWVLPPLPDQVTA